VTSLPSAREAITADGQLASVTFRRWLESLGSTASVTAEDIAAIATALGSPDGTVANIPDQDAGVSFVINGGGSVAVTGTLESGVFSVTLANDSANPGATHYYGTDSTGAKGWFERRLDTLADVDVSSPPSAGDALVYDGAAWVPGSVDSAVPFFIPDGTTYTVAANKQALFALPIELEGDAVLVLDGALVEVN
jgi:hypothetical protein